MAPPLDDKKVLMEKAFQSAFNNEDLLFQVVDLFPIPIEVFAPDGTTVFVNRAALEMWNVSGPEQIIGHYNLLQDPVVNDELGLREYVRRAFQGETLSVSDVKVTLEDMAERYEAKSQDFNVEALYSDIHSFPIWDHDKNIAYIVNVFITTRMYQGQSDIARAKEYIANHWMEEFSLEKVAKAVGLSQYHFARLFKKHTSMTPFNYYQEIKIGKLKEKLCDRNLSIAEAFSACGVEYNGNYARLFKAKVGMTPTQYRRTLQNK